MIDCYKKEVDEDENSKRFLDHEKSAKTFASLVAADIISAVNQDHPQQSVIVRRNEIGRIISMGRGCPLDIEQVTELEILEIRGELQRYIQMR